MSLNPFAFPSSNNNIYFICQNKKNVSGTFVPLYNDKTFNLILSVHKVQSCKLKNFLLTQVLFLPFN